MSQRRLSIGLNFAVWAGAILVLASTPAPAHGTDLCPNTDCQGGHNCEFLANNHCQLDPAGFCHVTKC